MPRGTRHTLTGTLGWDEHNRMYVLHMPGGGYWFLDMPGWRRHELGREMTVEGVRSDFNMLDVSKVVAVDGVAITSNRRAAAMRLLRHLRLI